MRLCDEPEGEDFSAEVQTITLRSDLEREDELHSILSCVPLCGWQAA